MKYTKEQLIAMSEVEIDMMKVNRYKKIFLMAGMAAAIVGAAAALGNVLPEGSAALSNIANAAMVANGITIPVNLGKVVKAFFYKSESEKALQEFKNGEIDEDRYYKDFIIKSLDYLNVTFDEIKDEAEKRMGRGM